MIFLIKNCYTSHIVNTDVADAAIWTEYVSRPCSLFAVSLWHYAYETYIPLICGGEVAMADGIFVQDKGGIVKNYRKKEQLVALHDFFKKSLLMDRQAILDLLAEARSLNKEAEKRLADQHSALGALDSMQSFENDLDLICKVTVFGAVMPRFVLDALDSCTVDAADDCTTIRSECEKLRAVSFYPRLLSGIIMPAVEREMGEAGRQMAPFVTIYELRKKDIGHARERLALSQRGNVFVYESSEHGGYEIAWKDHDDAIPPARQIVGKTAYPGIARGRARVCLTFNGEDLHEFNDGDILVTINSNPSLMRWIERASAIVSDEGGNTCHAAIISNDVKKPCIIGTGNATSMIPNGSEIEVDADKGQITVT